MIRYALAARAFVLKVSGALAWVAPTLARLTLGLVFVGTGWGKLHNLPRVVDYFTSLGIPAPQLQAPFVAGVELVGGLLILAGLFTRVASVPMAATMVVALLTAKRGDIQGLTDLFGTIEWLYLVGFAFLAAYGPGALSLDALLVHRLAAQEEPGGVASPAAPVVAASRS